MRKRYGFGRFLCLCLILALMLPASGLALSITNVNSQGNGEYLLRWSDSGSGEYKVTYSLDGTEITYTENTTRSKNTVLSWLIPGCDYTLKVENLDNGDSDTYYFSVPWDMYREFNIGNNKYVKLDKTSFSLSDVKKNRVNTFEVRISWPRLKVAREYVGMLALKTPYGYTSHVVRDAAFTFENRYSYRYWTFTLYDDWLTEVEDDYNDIPLGEYTFEFYADGRFYGSAEFRLSR